jgi:hypothetical protein
VTETSESARLVRFGVFEVDLRSGEVRKSGVRLKLGRQPFQVLAILLERPGTVITREELQKRLWPDTFVDVDHNLNRAVNWDIQFGDYEIGSPWCEFPVHTLELCERKHFEGILDAGHGVLLLHDWSADPSSC